MISTIPYHWRHSDGPARRLRPAAQAVAAFASIVHQGLALLPIVLPPVLALFILG